MKTNKHYLVFDLETKRSADEVGGWTNKQEMGISVGVVYDSEDDKYYAYLDDKLEEMAEHLLCGKTVIGYNHIEFDYPVLSGIRRDFGERQELLAKLNNTNNLDLMLDIQKNHRIRYKLDDLAKGTLQSAKIAVGTDALVWFKEFQNSGDKSFLKKIIDYCVMDVEVTKNVFLYGYENGKVTANSAKHGNNTLSVDWKSILDEKQEKKLQSNLMGGF